MRFKPRIASYFEALQIATEAERKKQLGGLYVSIARVYQKANRGKPGKAKK